MDYPEIHCIMVSVDYTDLLSLTLPYNRHHFASVTIVTALTHADTPNVVKLANEHRCWVHRTDKFWERGARFNKWAAMEEAMDASPVWRNTHPYQRPRWFCIMDADVCWPKDASIELTRILRPGFLYTPRRRMCEPAPSCVPIEETWSNYPLHKQEVEFAGYSQIFHSTDPRLSNVPWHQTDWMHAGGADSFFQARWPNECKVRPGFNVLHLGPAGVNWMGRLSHYCDGTKPAKRDELQEQMFQMRRRRREGRHLKGNDPYSHEKLK